MGETSATTVLNRIADALVVEAKFASKEDALRSMARSAVRDRIGRYRRRILRLERKYETDLAGFTRLIEGSATPQQEDDWFSWKSALETPTGRLEFKVRCRMGGEWQLQVWVHQGPSTFDYAYQRFTSAPLLRWDNAPHYPDIATAPHHFHDERNNGSN